MDTLVEKRKSFVNQSKRFSVAFSFILQLVLLMAGYQILTKDEMTKAGIHLDYYRNEEKL